MIRIDLGKSEKKGSSKSAFGSSLKLPEGLKLPGMNLDLKGMVMVGVVTAFAGLPHLFVMQYQSYIESQHQLALKALEEKENAAQQEVAKYTTYQREMESYEKQKQLVKERLEVVQRLLVTRSTPVNVLDAIGQSLPPRAWLLNIDFKLSPEPSQSGVILNGKAYSNEDVSDFIDKLTESIHLTDVSLDSVTSERMEKDIEARAFLITAMPKGTLSDASAPIRAQASTGAPAQAAAVPTPQTPKSAEASDAAH